MALPQIYTIDKKINSMAGLSAYTVHENATGTLDAQGHLHAPAGSPNGGQFIKKDGDGGGVGSAPKSVEMTESACGVPGDAGANDIKTIPRLKGLTPEQEAIEAEAISHFENKAERERLVNRLAEAAEKDIAERGSAIIETDAMKSELAKGWGTNAEYNPLANKNADYQKRLELEADINAELNKPANSRNTEELKKLQKKYEEYKNAQPLSESEQNRFDEIRAFRAENNSLLHQTANAIAKVAFERVAANHQGENFGITLGGCASGKGFGLEHPELFSGKYKGKSLSEYTSKTKLWWDSAGEQGGDELNWFARVANKNKSPQVTFLNTETNASAAAKNAGYRVADKGRLVAFNAFFYSYINTRANFAKFAKANKKMKNYNFITVQNFGKGAKDSKGNAIPTAILKAGAKLSAFPTKTEMKKVYADAIKASGLPKSVYDAAIKGMDFDFKF